MQRLTSETERLDRPIAEPVVRLNGLTKAFGASLALDAIDLEVPGGQLLVVLGLSGSGKSTLLRHLNGLYRPTSGAVEVLGVDVVAARGARLRHLRRRVGFVFQQFGLVGRATCMENVLSGALGRIHGPRFGRADLLEGPAARGAATTSTASDSPTGRSSAPTRCPAASSSASPSPAR